VTGIDPLPASVGPKELLHAGVRGTVAAMAMTGVRAFTQDVGLVGDAPPEAILKQRARGLIRRVPQRRRRGAVELAHWSYGAAGGVVFATLPDRIRRKPWAGPLYGLVVWVGFELAIAPALGLVQARQLRLAERTALAADHALYGFVLTETRRVARD
jgi:hypothetical protein